MHGDLEKELLDKDPLILTQPDMYLSASVKLLRIPLTNSTSMNMLKDPD